MVAVILAIDPGNTESGYALIEADTRRPVEVGKISNDDVLDLIATKHMLGLIAGEPDMCLAIEMIASYGMAVGAEVFATCVWVGRFQQLAIDTDRDIEVAVVYRRDVKIHHCGSARAKDANIAQALIDRFAPGVPNRGKGSKAAPGWFHGFTGDIWQAYALAVLVADTWLGDVVGAP